MKNVWNSQDFVLPQGVCSQHNLRGGMVEIHIVDCLSLKLYPKIKKNISDGSRSTNLLISDRESLYNYWETSITQWFLGAI